MNRFIFLGGLALMIGSALFSGCATPGPDEAYDTEVVSDRDVAGEVQDRLRMDSQTTKYTFDVRVEEGIVTLGGPVREASVRMRAIGIVRGTPGVKGVIDNMIQF